MTKSTEKYIKDLAYMEYIKAGAEILDAGSQIPGELWNDEMTDTACEILEMMRMMGEPILEK